MKRFKYNGYFIELNCLLSTNFFDKNGVEIFEGDTIIVPLSTGMKNKPYDFQKCKVVFESGAFFLDVSEIYSSQTRLFFTSEIWAKDCEVINEK
jgi:YopX protein